MCGSKGSAPTPSGASTTSSTSTSGASTGTFAQGPTPETAARYNTFLDAAGNLAQTPFNPAMLSSVVPLNTMQAEGLNELWMRGMQLGNWEPEKVQAIESPYIQDVVGASQDWFNNQNRIQGNQLIGQGIRSGNAFGGDRMGIAAAELAGQQQLAQAPVIAGLYQAGYTQALDEYNKLKQFGISGAEEAIKAGTVYQAQLQREADTATQNAAMQSAYPFQLANWYGSVLGGMGPLTGTVGAGTSSSTASTEGITNPPTPNPLNQILGIGSTLAGLFFKEGGYVDGDDIVLPRKWGGTVQHYAGGGGIYGPDEDDDYNYGDGDGDGGDKTPDYSSYSGRSSDDDEDKKDRGRSEDVMHNVDILDQMKEERAPSNIAGALKIRRYAQPYARKSGQGSRNDSTNQLRSPSAPPASRSSGNDSDGGFLGFLGGAAKLGAAVAPLFMMSDRKTKTDVQRVGRTDDDEPLYAFRYKGDPKTYPKVVGPMAHRAEGGEVGDWSGFFRHLGPPNERVPMPRPDPRRVSPEEKPRRLQGGGTAIDDSRPLGIPFDELILPWRKQPQGFGYRVGENFADLFPQSQMPNATAKNPNATIANPNWYHTDTATFPPAVAPPVTPPGTGGVGNFVLPPPTAEAPTTAAAPPVIDAGAGAATGGFGPGGDPGLAPHPLTYAEVYGTQGPGMAEGGEVEDEDEDEDFDIGDTGDTGDTGDDLDTDGDGDGGALPANAQFTAGALTETASEPDFSGVFRDIGPPGGVPTPMPPSRPPEAPGRMPIPGIDPNEQLTGRRTRPLGGPAPADGGDGGGGDRAPTVYRLPGGGGQRPRNVAERWAASPFTRAGIAMMTSRSPYFAEGLGRGLGAAANAIERNRAESVLDQRGKLITSGDTFMYQVGDQLIDLKIPTKGRTMTDYQREMIKQRELDRDVRKERGTRGSTSTVDRRETVLRGMISGIQKNDPNMRYPEARRMAIEEWNRTHPNDQIELPPEPPAPAPAPAKPASEPMISPETVEGAKQKAAEAGEWIWNKATGAWEWFTGAVTGPQAGGRGAIDAITGAKPPAAQAAPASPAPAQRAPAQDPIEAIKANPDAAKNEAREKLRFIKDPAKRQIILDRLRRAGIDVTDLVGPAPVPQSQ